VIILIVYELFVIDSGLGSSG